MDAGSNYERVSWKRSALLDGSLSGRARASRKKWWWLAPLLLLPLLLISTLWAVNHIEGDIVEAAEQILDDNGIDRSGLSFEADYRDLEVNGQLPEGVTAKQVETILQSNEGNVEDADPRDVSGTLREATPAALGAIAATATSDGDSIILSGTVPTQKNKEDLVAAAEATRMPVNSDGLTVSGLAPSSSDADGQIQKLSAVVGGLTAVAIDGAKLNVDDEGNVYGTIDAVDRANADRLAPQAGSDVDVSAPAEIGSLNTKVDYDGNRIILNGTVFSEEQSASLETAAAGVVGADNVVNNLEISDLEQQEGTDGRVASLAAVIGTFGGLEIADATMTDTDLTVNGNAPDDAAKEATSAAVAGADASLRPLINVTVPELSLQEEIDLLQAELDALQEEIRKNVVFASDSDVLTDKAKATLDEVVSAMERYPRPVVEIGGHTDSQGDDAYNEALSLRRAESVVAYVGGATSPDRTKPFGFGESQPIADNTIEEGRLQNRRVEFIAKESF